MKFQVCENRGSFYLPQKKGTQFTSFGRVSVLFHKRLFPVLASPPLSVHFTVTVTGHYRRSASGSGVCETGNIHEAWALVGRCIASNFPERRWVCSWPRERGIWDLRADTSPKTAEAASRGEVG